MNNLVTFLKLTFVNRFKYLFFIVLVNYLPIDPYCTGIVMPHLNSHFNILRGFQTGAWFSLQNQTNPGLL